MVTLVALVVVGLVSVGAVTAADHTPATNESADTWTTVEGGTQSWSFRGHRKANATPTVHDGVVYTVTDDETLVALDARSGDEQWRLSDRSPVESSIVVANETAFVGTELGSLLAIDVATGTVEWTVEDPSIVESSITATNGSVYAVTRSGTVLAVDAHTGDRRWQVETGAGTDWAPRIVGGTAYVSAQDSVTAIDTATGAVEWRFEVSITRVHYTPTVANGTVYAVASGGRLHAIDARTGQHEWTVSPSESLMHSDILTTDRALYVTTFNDTLYRIDRSSGTVEWARPGEYVWGLRVHQGIVVVERPQSVCGVGAGTGQQLWCFEDRTIRQATIANGTAYLRSRTGVEATAVDVHTGEIRSSTAEYRLPTQLVVWRSRPVTTLVGASGTDRRRLSRDRTRRWRRDLPAGVRAPVARHDDRLVVATVDGRLLAYRAGYHRRPSEAGTASRPNETRVRRAPSNSTPPVALRWRSPPSNVTSAPTVVDGRVVAVSDGTVRVFDAATGATVGQFHTRSELIGPPVVADGVAYIVTGDGRLLALDVATGRVRWRRDPTFGADPLPDSLAIAHGRLLVGTDDRTLVAFDVTDGERRWDVRFDYSIVDAPTVTDETAVVALDHYGFQGFVVALDVLDGSRRWSYTFDDHVPTGRPAVAGDHVVVATGETVRSFDARSGRHQWQVRPNTTLGTPPTVADGAVYVAGGDRLLAIGTDGQHRWTHAFGDRILGAPTVAAGRVYVSTPASVTAIGTDGERRWRYASTRPITTAVGVANGSAFVAGDAVSAVATGHSAPSSDSRRRQAVAGHVGDHPVSRPIVRFDANRSIEPGDWVRFDTDGTHAPGGRITNYTWQVDGRPVGTGPRLVHRFAASGPATVTLAVTDDDGHTAREQATVAVGDPPGARRWRFDTNRSMFASRVAVENDTVYAADGALHAVDLSTGRERWSFDGDAHLEEVAAARPAVIVAGENFDREDPATRVAAVDRTDGTAFWSRWLDASDILGIAVDETRLYFVTRGARVWALDVGTGATEWTRRIDATGLYGPVVANGTVHVTGRTDPYGSPDANATVASLDAATGRVQFNRTFDTRMPHLSPVVSEDRIVLTAGRSVIALDRVDHTVAWRRNVSGDRITPATVAGGRVYARTADGHLLALDVDDGRRHWRVDVGRGDRAPTVANGTVYVSAANGSLTAVASRTGRVRWRDEVCGDATPMVANGTLVTAVRSTVPTCERDAVVALEIGGDASSDDWRVRRQRVTLPAPPAYIDRSHPLWIGALGVFGLVGGLRLWRRLGD